MMGDIPDQSRVAGESVDYSKSLNNSTYTAGWLLDSLRKNDPVYKEKFGLRKVKDVTSFDVSEGKGFISIVLKCIVIFEDPVDENERYSTILKIPGFTSLDEANSRGDQLVDIEKIAGIVTEYHNFECRFYECVSPVLKDLPIPKVFKTVGWILNEQEGCIHMEDLSLKGKVMRFFDSLNLTQVKNVIKNVAKMHKQIWTMDRAIWEGKFLENQMNFLAIIDGIKTSMYTMEEMAKERCAAIIPLLQKYRNFCTNKDFMKYAFGQSYKDLNLNAVVVHGDLWASNIMFSMNSEGDFENTTVALIDWQLIHEGGPMDDIARFLANTVDGSIRRQKESNLLHYYLDVLTSELAKDNLEVPFTFDQIQEAYDYMFMINAALPTFVTVFMVRSLDENPESELINQVKIDKGILRSLHALEDLDRLLTGKYKHVFEKYGQ